MTRILLALAGTVVGLVALLSFKTHTVAGSAHGLPSATLPGGATSAPSTGSSSATGSGAASSSAPPNPAASTTAPAAPHTSAATRTIAGQAVDTRYGTVQVQVVVSGKTIKSVSFLQLTANDPHSQEINDQAGPLLLQETLSAQSSNIDTISGATFTSEGYLQSLQSALDQAGIN